MQYNSVLAQLQDYIVMNILEGAKVEIDEATPLLEWGIMNSLEIVQLVRFVQERFHVTIPANKLTGDNFINLSSITNLVLSCSEVEMD
jgi:acyl carrier protein